MFKSTVHGCLSVARDVTPNIITSSNNFCCCHHTQTTVITTLRKWRLSLNGIWRRMCGRVFLQWGWQPAAWKEWLRVIAVQLLAFVCVCVRERVCECVLIWVDTCGCVFPRLWCVISKHIIFFVWILCTHPVYLAQSQQPFTLISFPGES